MSFDNRAGFSGIKLPPDSTGKSLATGKYWDIGYRNATHLLKRGDYIVGELTNTVGEVVAVYPTDVSSGHIILAPEDDSAGSGFTVGETIRHEMDSSVLEITSIDEHHVQGFQLKGQNNPMWGQHVDKDGAAYFRFTEGQQQLDAYGLSRMVLPRLLASYNFKYDEEPEDFDREIAGSGSITYDPVASGVVLSVGTAAGDAASVTSNVYYPVWPGCGQLITMVIACGDSGKAGCRIRWGYFNKDNGVFFEREENRLYVVRRSNITGTVVDVRYSQAEWNTDTIGGATGDSDFVLDPTLINVYWYNIHTLTGGRMRFGVVDSEGFRITCHNEVDLNTSFLPTLRNMALPMRVEIENTSLTPSPSIVKFHAGNVFAEGPTESLTDSAISRFSSGHLQYGGKQLTDSTSRPIMSFRSATFFKGVENRIVSVPIGFALYTSAPVRLRVLKNAVLSGSVWEPAGEYTPVEKEETSNSYTGGREVHSAIYAAGAYNEALSSDVWGPLGECMTTKGAQGGYGDSYTVALQPISTGSLPIEISFAGRWKDIG